MKRPSEPTSRPDRPSARTAPENPEALRLEQAKAGAPWKLWGPYLSERQWGTVREDYSHDGSAWDSFPHDHARSRAYRWGEDGIAGFSDDRQLLCFSLALWNGQDAILKERLFGLTNREGNHGEDVKELYHYLDATPTHSYLCMSYRYPQREYPYRALVEESRARGLDAPELEIYDTGAFAEDRYFDVTIEYAKASETDTLIRIRAHNAGPEAAELHLLPQLWFRNTWSWAGGARPELRLEPEGIVAEHAALGSYRLAFEPGGTPLFTDNDTNVARLYGATRAGHYKDAFHEHLVHGRADVLRRDARGTKAALHYLRRVEPGATTTLLLRLSSESHALPLAHAAALIERRRVEADAFYARITGALDAERARIHRQAIAGMIWSKQFFYFDVRDWLRGDPAQPAPPAARRHARNTDWEHLNNADILSMPDKWEYPWYAAWDLAFHCLPLASVDPEFAKAQLVLLTREWFMHPNGQLPAYEWAFGDVNPPVHAWAAWRVYEIDKKLAGGKGDVAFLERVFHKLMLNFTWWVNRKDKSGRNIFQGGFLGLDNIGVFDRSAPLPTGGHIDQADGTSWMAMYALNLLRIALELARHNAVYEDIATKFFEHFLHIAEAMNDMAGRGVGLWDEQDAFFYDVLRCEDGSITPLRVRSMVGLIPLFAVEVLEPDLLAALPEFAARLRWFLDYRPDLAALVARWSEPGNGDLRLLALLRGKRMKHVLRRMLDETEFLSEHGVRALSRQHADQPYAFTRDGVSTSVRYQPGESDSGLFGGNSNWRGPVWFPVNHLIIESLRKFHRYYGDDFRVECPTGSGTYLHLGQVADELAARLTRLFLRGADGVRPIYRGTPLAHAAGLSDQLLFYEYFHGDSGRGVGASHQTGWTGLIALHLDPRKP
jgi:hypothetical protein